MKQNLELFGSLCLNFLKTQPIGSLSKRELELKLIKADIGASIFDTHPGLLAEQLNTTLTKAKGYITDITLSSQMLSDKEAIIEIFRCISKNEIVPEATHITIPIYNTALQIWLERKMALKGLYLGESLNKRMLKLSITGLINLLENASEIIAPKDAIIKLEQKLKDDDWVQELIKKQEKTIGWKDIVSITNSSFSFGEHVTKYAPLNLSIL